MSTPLYSLEEALERSVVNVLSDVAALDDCRITAADVSDEDSLPMISVRAEKLEEVVLGMQTWNARVAITLTTEADETPEEERAGRRLPDPEDTDNGAAGFKSLWKTLSATVDAAAFTTSLNEEALCYVWGLEFEPVTYENNDRSFARTIACRLWVNEVLTTEE